MELAQDWRLYQKLTRSRKKRMARLAVGEADASGSSPVTVVISSGAQPKVVTVFSQGRQFEDWGGRAFEEFRSHFGEVKSLCVLTESELRDSFGVASGAHGLFEQRRSLRASLEKKAAHRKGAAPLPGVEDNTVGQSGHFLIEALGGWWRKVLPNRYALWIRLAAVEGGATGVAGARALPQDQVLFFKEGEVVGCCTPDLTSLGGERIWKDAAVIRHLSEKYLVPVQGIQTSGSEWESWMDAPKPWKAVWESLNKRNAVFLSDRSTLRNLVRLRAWTGI